MEDAGGYRVDAVAGPRVRTDIVDVYIFRRARGVVEFLQLLRSADPLKDTWHPVMGHIERGETATACALRELEEEVGLRAGDPAFKRMWALEQVHPFVEAAGERRARGRAMGESGGDLAEVHVAGAGGGVPGSCGAGAQGEPGARPPGDRDQVGELQ